MVRECPDIDLLVEMSCKLCIVSCNDESGVMLFNVVVERVQYA